MSSYLTYDQYKSQEKEAWILAAKGTEDKERNRSHNFDRKGASNSSDNFEEYKQHITIMPNPALRRRASISNYAFPELHSKSKKDRKKEPDNILMFTRTTTDAIGRRHSVTVPLIPPADGERFEGGYHIEKNPITGGARLVPPSKSIKERVSEHQSRSREMDCKISGNSTTNSIRPGSWRNRSRRHSVQVESISTYHKERLERQERLEQLKKKDPEKVENLTKDLEKMNVSSSNFKRRNSQRRSSAQGFLHFLDLAIAN